jgi:hypothetical protein
MFDTVSSELVSATKSNPANITLSTKSILLKELDGIINNFKFKLIHTNSSRNLVSNDNADQNFSTEIEFDSKNSCELDYIEAKEEEFLIFPDNNSNLSNLADNKFYKSDYSEKEYRRLYSHLILSHTSTNMLREMKKEEILLEDFLKNHNISYRDRSKMLGWMLEIFQAFEMHDSTFFSSINIMDRYFKKCPKINLPSEIHLIGMISMNLAVKMNYVSSWDYNILGETIGKNKFSHAQLTKMEIKILKYTNYCLLTPNVYDFVLLLKEIIFFNKENDFLIRDYRLQEYFHSLSKDKDSDFLASFQELKSNFHSKFIETFNQISIFLSKLVMFDHYLSGKLPSLLAVSVINVSLNLNERIFKSKTEIPLIIDKLRELILLKIEEIHNINTRIVYLLENIEQSHLIGISTLNKAYKDFKMLII